MSQLKALICKVSKVENHPSADKLDIANILGWQSITARGNFKSGDLAVYLPVDSVLPDNLVKLLGIEKNYHKRLRTIKLRGMISQGMVMSLEHLKTFGDIAGLKEGDDVTAMLGITKYEVPIPVHMSGILLPEESRFIRYTDIENLKNYPNVFGQYQKVIISEKIHGTNWRAAKIDGQLYVGSHRQNLKRDDQNLYWRAAMLLDLDNKLQEGEQVFGEVYGNGIQDLQYGCKQGEIRVALFDIFKGGKYIDFVDFNAVCKEREWPTVPWIVMGEWGCDDVKEYVDPKGASTIAPGQIMEGVVIKPIEECYSEALQGRLIVKAISAEYLLKKDRTEFH